MTTLTKFLLSADWHLTNKQPVARLDEDWIDTQRKALRFLVDTAILKNCPLVAVGDIFDKAKVSPEIVNMAIEELLRLREYGLDLYLLAGNHDLVGARADSIPECSIGALLSIFPKIPQINGIQDARHFGEDEYTGAEVVFTHQLIFESEKARPPTAKGKTASDLLREYEDAKWVFCGDMHHTFRYESNGRNVVNTGNLIPHNASMIETEAMIAYIDLDAEVVEWIKVPDDPSLLSREHLDVVERKENRLAAFTEYIKDAIIDGIVGFEDKMEIRMSLKDITSAVEKAFLEVKELATKGEK